MPADKILFMNTTTARKLWGQFLQTFTRTAASGWKILKQSTEGNYDSWRVWNKNKLKKDRVTPWMEMFKGVTSGSLFEEALWDMLTALFHNNWEVWNLLQNGLIVPINTTIVTDFDRVLPFGVVFRRLQWTHDCWTTKLYFYPLEKWTQSYQSIC